VLKIYLLSVYWYQYFCTFEMIIKVSCVILVLALVYKGHVCAKYMKCSVCYLFKWKENTFTSHIFDDGRNFIVTVDYCNLQKILAVISFQFLIVTGMMVMV
jgi:hypothetical protein